ncbi:Unannotated [Lentimonas sp. CC19]|nr:Unannotated [Lentimonas sp. CC4]CAA6684437.1 Unannotated [Lentimonas sp. CC6]CAA6692812.1 Unannotated [Lentimonas sp. CC19]CAA6695025.1 Unannotated [Lentimonas sp. CC10]CAA7069638.1 Unannotated [Lentimonas sp. CC11]CAA7171318.1 Unannotated [Lentimonas sp. CC21]CAA7183348.1 Unannotated [Lentimonas sp. CC8]
MYFLQSLTPYNDNDPSGMIKTSQHTFAALKDLRIPVNPWFK